MSQPIWDQEQEAEQDPREWEEIAKQEWEQFVRNTSAAVLDAALEESKGKG